MVTGRERWRRTCEPARKMVHDGAEMESSMHSRPCRTLFIAFIALTVAVTAPISFAADPADAPGFPGVLPKPREYRERGDPILLAGMSQTLRVRCVGENPA